MRRSDGEFLGIAGFGGPTDMPEVGYWIGSFYRGQNYATEALRALVDLVRHEGGSPVALATRIEAFIDQTSASAK